jgi:hypothetical protein
MNIQQFRMYRGLLNVCRDNKYENLKEFVDANADLMYHGNAPLKTALMRENLETVEDLLKYVQPDIGYSCHEGSPLAVAVKTGNADLVYLLLKSGARTEGIRPEDWEKAQSRCYWTDLDEIKQTVLVYKIIQNN